MKPIAISSCLALAALSLFAADPQTTYATPTTAHSETLLSSPRTAGIGDSPLVQAAKATNRLNKKPGQVITNETLVHVGGHFTTTTPQAQTTLPAQPLNVPTMDQLAIQERRARAETAAAADAARKLAQQKKTAAGLAAARAEGDTAEGIYTDPPALENETIQTGKPLSPEAMTQKQKPPM
jgi:hypothetical protein